MLLSGLFFFRTFTPVFFWSKGKIEELSYFKMKSKLHIQLYTLPSTPFLDIPSTASGSERGIVNQAVCGVGEFLSLGF